MHYLRALQLLQYGRRRNFVLTRQKYVAHFVLNACRKPKYNLGMVMSLKFFRLNLARLNYGSCFYCKFDKSWSILNKLFIN